MTDSPNVVKRLTGPLDAVVTVPGSKSIANRALACAALTSGRSLLHNLPDGDDVNAMVTCLGLLGASVHDVSARHRPGVGYHSVEIVGRVPFGPTEPTTVNAGLAGTTSRFLVGLSALSATPVTIDGAAPLRRRPFAPLLDALGELGAAIVDGGEPGHLPVSVSGPLTGARVALRGDVSSQFITALMLIAPLCPHGLTINLTTELVSRPYVELTEATMGDFGFGGAHVGADLITVEPGQYEPAEVSIEADASSASYPLALAAIVGGTVRVPDLGSTSRQGDATFVDLLAQMGCQVSADPTGTVVSFDRSQALSGIDIDMADISDLVPTVAAVAATANSPSRIRGVGFIRGKESDRLGDLTTEFRKLGVLIEETEDGLNVEPSSATLRPARIDPHDDHRLAMSSALLGCAVGDVEIDDPSVVAKSWPGFWDMLNGMHRDVSERNSRDDTRR